MRCQSVDQVATRSVYQQWADSVLESIERDSWSKGSNKLPPEAIDSIVDFYNFLKIHRLVSL